MAGTTQGAKRWVSDWHMVTVTKVPLPRPAPSWHRPLTFLAGLWNKANSQLMLASVWEGGQAGCQGRPRAQRTFCATVPSPARPSPLATSCAPGSIGLQAPPLISAQLTEVAMPPPPRPWKQKSPIKMQICYSPISGWQLHQAGDRS
jgi:hypothetical protein